MISLHQAKTWIKEAGGPATVRRPTAVIIDDQSASRATFRRILMSLDMDIDIETFSHPREALDWCKKTEPALIITDFRMPEFDGIELVNRFRTMETTMRTPIIVATITSDKALKGRALNAGATDFVQKPIDHDECRARCRNLLAISEYQMQLRDRIESLNLQINAASRNANTVIQHAASVSHVGIGYDELFMLTSTVAAIDKLLTPLKATIANMEEAVQLPLAGSRILNDR